MSTIIERYKLNERERAKEKERMLTDGTVALHARQHEDGVIGDVEALSVKTGSTVEHIVSRLTRLDKRAEAAVEALALPVLLAAQEKDDAAHASDVADLEREIEAYRSRSAERHKQISRAKTRRGYNRETVRFASWELFDSLRGIDKEVEVIEREQASRIVPTEAEGEFIGYDHFSKSVKPHQFTDGGLANEAMDTFRARVDEFESRKVELAARLEVLHARKAALLELAIEPFPKAEQVAAIMAGDMALFDGDDFEEGGDDGRDDE